MADNVLEKQMSEGAAFLSHIWFMIAQKVLDTAAAVYELSPEQAAALRRAFLRPNDFVVEPY